MPFRNRKKKYLEDLFSSVLSQFKKFLPSINLNLNYLGIFHSLRIFQRNGLKLDKDLIFSGSVQNVYVYRMAKSEKI